MSETRENISFTNPWSAQPAAGNDQLLPCLESECQLEFPDSDTRYEHSVTSHPYWRPSPSKTKPFKCRLCRKTYKLQNNLKAHIKYKHKPKRRGPTASQEDQDALILQSHAPAADKKRSEVSKKNENVQGHHVGHEDEATEEQPHFVYSRRNSLLNNEVVQYIKRKGSQIIAPLAEKIRNSSILKPHAVVPAATEVVEDGQSTDVGVDQTLPLFRAPD